ncbi:unnamed protein product [marine sediment metagenome]|uniref:Uncharacterized protein n=1 Tax=marine sediment metagenome TaxID=412755 RepID=X1RTP8_9ZZZZ
MIQLEVISPSTKPAGPSTELLSVGASVPIGTEGKIHIVGRNDTPTPQEMGCEWVVKDPDGKVVEEHTNDWAGWPWPTDVDPDDTHEFISFLDEGFDLNKEGTYTIAQLQPRYGHCAQSARQDESPIAEDAQAYLGLLVWLMGQLSF